MAIISSLNIIASASTEKLTKGLNAGLSKIDQFKKKAEGKSPSLFGNVQDQFKGLQSGLMSIKGAFVAIGAAVAAIGLAALTKGIQSLTSAGMERIDNMADSAAKLGMSIQDLSELSYGASFAGVNTEGMDTALNKLNVNMGEAINGSKTAQDTFAKLGISMDTIREGDTGEVFKQAAQAISELPTAAQQAAAAVDLFGKSGTQLLPFLQGGKEGIDAMAQEAQALGVSISAIDAAQVGAAQDAMDRLWKIVEGLGNELAIQLAPIIEAVATYFVDAAKEGLNWGTVVSGAIDMVVGAIGVLLDVWHTLKLGFMGVQWVIVKGLAWIVTAVAKLAQGIDWVISKLTGSKSGIGEALSQAADSMHQSAATLAQDLGQKFAEQTPSEKLHRWLDDVRAKSKKAAETMVEQQNATKGVADAMNQASVDAQKLIDKLQDQVNTFGMTSAEAEIYKLKIAGANPELIAQAQALSDQLKALEESKKAEEEWKQKAKSIFDETRTPLEKFNQQMEEIKTLWAKGLIDTETFKRAEAKFKKDLVGEYKAPELLTKGSQQAETFLNQWRFGNQDPQIQALDALGKDNEDQLKVLQEIAKGVNRITIPVVEEVDF